MLNVYMILFFIRDMVITMVAGACGDRSLASGDLSSQAPGFYLSPQAPVCWQYFKEVKQHWAGLVLGWVTAPSAVLYKIPNVCTLLT